MKIQNRMVREILDQAKEWSWEPHRIARSNHLQLRHKNGKIYVLGSSPSNNKRVMQNALSDLKRMAMDEGVSK